MNSSKYSKIVSFSQKSLNTIKSKDYLIVCGTAKSLNP